MNEWQTLDAEPVRRKRGRVVAAGVGAIAVAGAVAGAIVLSGGTSAGAAPERSDQVAANVAHLRAVLPTLMPGAENIKVTTYGGGADARMFTAEVTFTDDKGPGTFTVTVSSGPGMKSLDEACGPDKSDGKPLRCTKTKRPGGDTLVVSEGGETADITSDTVTEVTSLDAIDYRGGDNTVSVVNDRFLPTILAPHDADHLRPTYPLDERQLTALVTDEQLGLHR